MNRYLATSSLVHLIFVSFILFFPGFPSKHDAIWITPSADFLPGTGGAKGGGASRGSGLKKKEMGQPVPAPRKIPLPSKAQPVSPATKAAETWKIKGEKTTKADPKDSKIPAPQAKAAKVTKAAKTNVVSRGIEKGEEAGEGFVYGPASDGKTIGIGTGDGPGVGGDGIGGFGYGSYLKNLRNKIWSVWSEFIIFGTKKTCVVRFTVSRMGQVSRIRMDRTSGDSFFDTVAMRTIRNAAPMPPLPPGFPKSSETFRIEFVIEE